MSYLPVYNVYSDDVKRMLNVKDDRSVKARLKKKGVEIYGEGKDSYIVTEEFIEAIRKENNRGCIYVSKNKEDNCFI